MIAWLRTNRRLQSEVAYLREQLAAAKTQPAPLIVTSSPHPGPRPGPAPHPAASAPAPTAAAERPVPAYDVEEILRGQIRALAAMKTVTGAAALAVENRRLRELTAVQQELLERAQRADEGSDLELLLMTDRATTAEEELAKHLRATEFPGVRS